MSGDSILDKQGAATTAPPPRMLGDTDVGVILKFAKALRPQSNILEVGPWLGGLTRELAPYGHITVADRFLWTDLNAQNYPGIAEPGDRFRNAFEANMAAEAIKVDVIETTLPAMTWDGRPLDLVVIDAPRDAEALHGCLAAIAESLRQDATIVVKHALNPRNFEMGAYLDALIGLGLASIETTEQPDWCNIATVRVKPGFASITQASSAAELIARAPMPHEPTDPWYGNRLTWFRLAYLATSDQWAQAYAKLAEMQPNVENLIVWDQLEPQLLLAKPDVDHSHLACLSELVWIHNDQRTNNSFPVRPHPGFARRLLAFWRNNAGRPWLFEGLVPELLGDANANHTVEIFAANLERVFDSDVFEVGQHLGPCALGALLCGARSYYGFELANVTAQGELLTNQFPHLQIGSGTDDGLKSIQKATVLIYNDNDGIPEDLLGALNKRARAHGGNVTVIKTPL